MNTRAVAYVAYGQILLAFFLAVCVALHPGLVLKSNEGGVSNYGIHTTTVIPYTLAFGLGAVFTILAANFSTRGQCARRYVLMLRLYGGILFLTLMSTYGYSENSVLRILHIVIGSTLVVVQCVISIWIYGSLNRSIGNRVLMVAQLSGTVLAALTLLGIGHLLFVSQLLAGTAFALLLVRTGRTLAVSSTDSQPAPRF